MHQLFSKQAFEPEELDYLRKLYDEFTSQPWFDQSDEAKEAFAKYLMETFPPVVFDAQRHRSAVEASARLFYAAGHATAA